MLRKMQSCAAALILMVPLFQRPVNKDTTELMRLEAMWNEAYMRGDADTLDRLCAYDLVVTMTDMSVQDKAKSLALLKAGPIKFVRYETSDVRIRVYGDAAVITGRLQRTRSVNGQNADDDWRFTKMYVRQNRRWQVVAWHASTNARF